MKRVVQTVTVQTVTVQTVTVQTKAALSKLAKQISLLISLCFLLISCEERLDRKMYDIVQRQYQIDKCKINFKNIIDKPWDKLIIVDEFIIPSEISDSLGFEYRGKMVKDDESRIILVHGTKIINETSFHSVPIVVKKNHKKGINVIYPQDTFCATYNTKVQPAFYFLKKD